LRRRRGTAAAVTHERTSDGPQPQAEISSGESTPLARRERTPPLTETNAGKMSQISKKRKFVADGLFYAELNELLTRELAEDGYAGVEVRVTPLRTEVIIRATRTQNVLGEKGQRIRELTSVVQKRFHFQDGAVELYAERVANRGLCSQAQAESLKYKLLGGLAVRRACYGVVRFVMESGAKGVEVVVSGKLRAQRAKAMKFTDGYMIKTGHSKRAYIDAAVRHVLMRQGVLGVKVSIMLPHDATGKTGPKEPLADVVTILEPKEEAPAPAAPTFEDGLQKPPAAQPGY
jgi:ribosomal protein uS3